MPLLAMTPMHINKWESDQVSLAVLSTWGGAVSDAGTPVSLPDRGTCTPRPHRDILQVRERPGNPKEAGRGCARAWPSASVFSQRWWGEEASGRFLFFPSLSPLPHPPPPLPPLSQAQCSPLALRLRPTPPPLSAQRGPHPGRGGGTGEPRPAGGRARLQGEGALHPVLHAPPAR